MTSIEWLWEEIDNLIPYQDINSAQQFNGLLEKAKEMHKQEIIEAYCNGNDLIGAEQYYQETFASKGSDEHIVDTNEMISDKEILNVAYDKYVIEDEIEAFIQGANWMQEQLKIKS